MKEKIIQRAEYSIVPFREILITDPWYLENENTATRTDLVFKEKPRCCNLGCIIVTENDYDSWKSIDFTILLASTEARLDTYKQNREYVKKTKRVEELGCDTACFIVGVWDKKGQYRELDFDTGADGFYGLAKKYKEGYGMRIDLSVDADVMSFDDVLGRLSYLFNFNLERDRVQELDKNEENER